MWHPCRLDWWSPGNHTHSLHVEWSFDEMLHLRKGCWITPDTGIVHSTEVRLWRQKGGSHELMTWGNGRRPKIMEETWPGSQDQSATKQEMKPELSSSTFLLVIVLLLAFLSFKSSWEGNTVTSFAGSTWPIPSVGFPNRAHAGPFPSVFCKSFSISLITDLCGAF